MGFTTGFLGGVTLTTSLLYLTTLAHQRNRAAQSLQLRQQNLILTGLVEPESAQEEPGRHHRTREVRVGVAEMAKDRWNAEIEGLARRAQRTDWRRVRDGAEEGLGAVVGRVRGWLADR